MDSKNKTNKFPKIEEMTKEQLRKTIIRKRETNARAQKIVESLLEPGITEEQFLSFLPHINQCHLNDIVEERAIIKMCGYPLCNNKLSPKDIPKQQYRISLKANKVYDISARKNYCSNVCYKATCYIKKQMLTSPLWFREYEIIPNFKLMPAESSGSMGQEVDLSIIEKVKKDSPETKFISINEFTNASFHDMNLDAVQSKLDELDINDEVCKNNSYDSTHSENIYRQLNDNLNDQKENKNVYTTEKQIRSHVECETSINKVNSKSENGQKHKELKKVKEHNESKKSPRCSSRNNLKKPSGIIGDVIEKPEKKIDPIIITGRDKINAMDNPNTKKSTASKEDPIFQTIIHVEKCLAEWFTLDTMIFLFGEAKVKEMVADKGDSIKNHLDKMANGLQNSEMYLQYQQLCRKLNMLELQDNKFDNKVLSRETKPLPDYTILKEESKRMQLKVKSFFSGELEVPESTDTQIQQPTEEDLSNLTNLALVDSNSQNALRRKILLKNLNKTVHDIQRSLGIEGISIASDVRLLVNSFKLRANNIMFKPIQWPLIGVVIIKLLSLKNPRIQCGLETAQSDKNLQLIMLSYKQDGGYLDRLLLWLTDLGRLLDTCDNQLTVG